MSTSSTLRPPQIGQEVELYIERLGINGEGVAHLEGFTLFVDGALPGERVRARIVEKRKNFGRAQVVARLTISAHRVQPVCPLFGTCGGCQLMHLNYAQQLEAKRQRVVDALQRIGKLFDVQVLPCMPSPSPTAYRNKIQLPVGAGLQLGLYARNTHDLIPIDKCYIHCELGEKVFQHVQRTIRAFPVEGELKHVLIKTAVNTQQVLVVLVTVSNEPLVILAEKLMAGMPEIKGVVQNINPADSNVILSTHFRKLAGQDWIEERLHGLLFKVSPASFFQVNPAQAEKLYQQVVEFAELTGEEIVLDAYCGVGTLSLILSQYAKETTGVECVPEAISDAQENAKRNAVGNAKFFCAPAEEFISRLNEVDVAVLNPPRKGCEPLFLQSLVKLAPKRIVYVSCDPATLARDLQFLCLQGYRVDAVQPFDMFPQTAHVECVVLLKKIGS